jgi:hypothetical protein
MPIPSNLPLAPPSNLSFDEASYLAQRTLCTGNVYYVQSTSVNAKDNALTNGVTALAPFKTLNYALANTTPNQQDLIYVLAGHVETVASAAALTAATGVSDGVTVVFCGNEADRGEINFTTATTATFTITANNVTLVNPRFVNSIDALAAPISITGSDCKIYNGQWFDGTSIYATIQIITTAAAKRLTINGWTYYEGTAGTTKTEAIRIVGGSNHRLLNLNIVGSFSTSVVNNVTTATTGFYGAGWNLNNLTPGPGFTYVSTSTFAGSDSSPAALSAGGEIVASKILALPGSATTQTVFTITGGPIEMTYLGGLVTTTIGATATTLKFSTVNTIGTLDLCTAGTITSLAVNTPVLCVTSTGTALNVAGTAGVTPIAASTLPMNQACVAPGTIIITTSANAGGGAFQYFMRYRPLGPNVVVS